MRAPRTIRARLTLLFLLIVAAAIGGLYLYVVPTLQQRLTQDKLDALRQSTLSYGPQVARAVSRSRPAFAVAAEVRAAASATASRIALLRVGRAGGEPRTELVTDSSGPRPAGDLRYGVGLDAVRSGRTVTGTESASTGQWAQAARPFRQNGRIASVVVVSQPLADVQRNVSVVRRRIIVAGGLALVFGVLAGFVVAGVLSRRVRRLEHAAEEIAAGNFSRSIPVDSDDELGDLTRAFNEMQRQLAEVDRARKSFIATASHELRTPIFSLGGFVELLQDDDVDEEDRARFVAQIGEQVERLRKLAVDLLDLSRIESGAVELRPESVDLAELSRSVAAEFEPALANHDSHLELRLGTGPAEAFCDPVRVAQVLRILVDNALRHTPPGTDIVVTAQQRAGATRLAVRDHGDGIDPGDVERIFQPFVTAEGAQGSGLGLAIARELAERMRGSLSAESRPGRTTFTLEVPDT
jgi:two-component system OmpR family sensor kinase